VVAGGGFEPPTFRL